MFILMKKYRIKTIENNGQIYRTRVNRSFFFLK